MTVLCILFLSVILGSLITASAGALTESERLIERSKRNYTWPLTYIPNTEGWAQLFDERFHQVEEIHDSGKRYEGYMQSVRAAALMPNFTELGFGLARCPDELTETLRQAIRDGLPTARHENGVEVIDAPEKPLFVDRPDLTKRVLTELQSYAEAWSGVALKPHTAYGFRLYQNHSQLTMHVDKMQTHIISFILHIDSSEDAEPWPIFIEDFKGRTHEVILTPGDMLFYESSKCFHGRPRRLNGSWYSSIFVHYFPADGWEKTDWRLESHYIVPEHWNKPAPTVTTHTRLEMVGTSLKEPDCQDDWCRAQESIKWSGPGEKGVWIDPNLRRQSFNPKVKDEL